MFATLLAFSVCGLAPCDLPLRYTESEICYTGEVQIIDVSLDAAPRDCDPIQKFYNNKMIESVETTNNLLQSYYAFKIKKHPAESNKLNKLKKDLLNYKLIIYFDTDFRTFTEPIDLEIALCD